MGNSTFDRPRQNKANSGGAGALGLLYKQTQFGSQCPEMGAGGRSRGHPSGSTVQNKANFRRHHGDGAWRAGPRGNHAKQSQFGISRAGTPDPRRNDYAKQSQFWPLRTDAKMVIGPFFAGADEAGWLNTRVHCAKQSQFRPGSKGAVVTCRPSKQRRRP